MEKTKIKEIIKLINSAVEKNRGTLSEDDAQVISKALEVFEKLEDSEAGDVRKNMELIAIYLLKFFSNPIITQQISEWLDKWFNN
jgi:hypothetical protein